MIMWCVFAVQASVTLLMLGFCMTMLARGGETGVYLPVMTGITGFWFPSPLQVVSPLQVQVQRQSHVQSQPHVQQHMLAQTHIELAQDSPV